jgi:organic radical activating enzyme
MLEYIKGFHIEPTNICTLKCPRCSRTKFNSQFPKKLKNKQLDLESLKKFIDIDITNKLFNLCGGYGDPIYYDSLFPLIDWIKNNNGVISLSTNGSYKTKDWWNTLASKLTVDDTIVFGIDGIPENFTQYRINADWDSIKVGIEQVVGKVTTIWQYIPFSFNQTTIESARTLSTNLGIDHFLVLNSDRWDNDSDHLQPSSVYTGNKTSSKISWHNKYNDISVDPRCTKNNDQHYITADGYYAPCCFIGDHRFYYSSEFYKNKEIYNISSTTLTKVLFNTNKFYQSLEEQKLKVCTFNCPKL